MSKTTLGRELTESMVLSSSYAPFYKYELKPRGYRPVKRILREIERDGRKYYRLKFVFRSEKRGDFILHISKKLPIYFTAIDLKGSKFVSEFCNSHSELEGPFCRYFKRRTPLLPRKFLAPVLKI